MGIAAGTRFGPYEITAPLGAGGMGEVYRAVDSRLNREVALKLVRQEGGTAGRNRRFLNEALLLSRLTHPNIAMLYELDHANDMDFLVLELVTGETLAERIRRGVLPEAEAAAIAEQAAAALEHAHAHGIVHQDLKPANMILTPEGGLKVLDFGVARVFSWAEDAPTVLATNRGGGTALYMAPEQLRGEDTSAQTDIYCLGAVLYEMLTGRRPFTGPTQAMVTDAILYAQPERPSLWSPAVSPALDEITLRCLEREPAHRFPSAAALRAALKGRESHASGTGWRATTGTAAAAAGRRRSLVVLPAQVLGPETEHYLGDAIASALSTYLGETAEFDLHLSPRKVDVERLEGGVSGAMRAHAAHLFLLAQAMPQGARLAIHLQLVEKATQRVLWSKELETERDSMFAALRGAARAAAEALGAAPASRPAVTTPKSGSRELAFQDALYRAHVYLQRGHGPDLEAAAARLREFADSGAHATEACAMLARLYASAPQRGMARAEAVQAARQWAQRALAADAGCSRAWAALSAVEALETGGFGRQLEFALRAAALGPEDPVAHLAVSAALAHSSHVFTLAACRHARSLDPLDVGAAVHEATLEAMLGRREEALLTIGQALELGPDSPHAAVGKAAVLCLLDDAAGAGAWTQQRLRPLAEQGRVPQDWVRFFLAAVDLGTTTRLTGPQFAEARDYLTEAASGKHPFNLWQVLTQGVPALLARAGEHDAALEVLEARTGAGLLDPYDYFLLHRHFERLRPHPRFQAAAGRSRGALVTTLAVLERARALGEFPGYLTEPWIRYAGLAALHGEAVTEAPA